jgi:hypothetical protein
MHTRFFKDSNRLVVSSVDWRTNLMVVENPYGIIRILCSMVG